MTHTNVPFLETERLQLRGFRLDDFPKSHRIWSTPDVVKYIGGKPSTRTESWSRLLRYVGHWDLLQFGYWAVTEKVTKAYVGEAGFANFERDIEPSLEGVPEIGWALNPEFQGRGLASEAVQAIVQWGDEHFDAEVTACIISPENQASIRIAEKCSYTRFAIANFNRSETLMFRRARKI